MPADGMSAAAEKRNSAPSLRQLYYYATSVSIGAEGVSQSGCNRRASWHEAADPKRLLGSGYGVIKADNLCSRRVRAGVADEAASGGVADALVGTGARPARKSPGWNQVA